MSNPYQPQSPQPPGQPGQPKQPAQGPNPMSQPMSGQPAPQQGQQPPASKPKKKSRVVPAVITGIAALLLGIGIGSANGGGTQTAGPAAPGATVTATTTATVTAAAPAPAETSAAAPTDQGFSPKRADFNVKTKVTKKQCFGSAGCNVTVSIDPSYTGSAALPDAGTIEVTYEISGDEDGPVVNTFTVVAGKVEYTKEESLTTKSSSSKIAAEITDVTYDPEN